MRDEIIEKYAILNNQIVETKKLDPSFMDNTPSIYEVIRIIQGVPIFLDRHMIRLRSSAEALGISLENLMREILHSISTVIEKNDCPEKNIKLLVYQNPTGTPQYAVYFIKSVYPDREDYFSGVPAILYQATRSNPNAKVVNTPLKEKVALALKSSGAYEALLVNEKNHITEGSRSNFFVVLEDSILTAPSEDVLIGITRICVFELCRRFGIAIVEKPVDVSLLDKAEGLFLTGTSPKILPISKVDDCSYPSSNPIVQRLIKAYDQMIEEEVQRSRSPF